MKVAKYFLLVVLFCGCTEEAGKQPTQKAITTYIDTPVTVMDIPQMKNYSGRGNLIFVLDSLNRGYYSVYHGVDSADEVSIFTGTNGRRWKKVKQ